MKQYRPTASLLPAVIGCMAVVALGYHASGDTLPDDWHVDRTLYPKAYGAIADEHLMFPMDMSEWPLKIDRSHQLFLDDYLIASTENIEREVHPAEKHPANPVLMPENPWEGAGAVFQIVRRDETAGRFRMWYAGHVRYELPSGTRVRFPTLYAESDDGISWEKPELGLHEFNGSKANNIVIPAGNPYGLIVEPDDPNPNRRYKAIVWHEPEYVPREGYFLYTSPDGIHWKRERDKPLAISLLGYNMPQSGIGDTSIFRWDRLLEKYVCDSKFVLPGVFRCRGMMESDDLVHWTRPRMTLYPDALDEPDSQVYGHLSFCYESLWIGFLRMMHTERTGWKQTTVELTASRDGRHWTRVGRREAFIPLGEPGDWDADYHDPCWDPILVGDELWIYYRSVNRDPNQQKVQVGHAIGLATLRRDGFVSLNAGPTTGAIVTRPLNFEGERLRVNAEVDDGGWIKVALLGEANQPIEGYTVEDVIPFKSGGARIPVRWRNAAGLRLTPGSHARLKFQMKSAKLYSFWIE